MGVVDDQGLAGLKGGLDKCIETSRNPGVTTITITEGSTASTVWGAATDTMWCSFINDSVQVHRGVGWDIN